MTELTSKVPDTITTWNAEAFAISNQTGLGISPLVQLTVKKDMFVSLELPYSVIFGEAVTITPLVFYFGDKKEIVVCISMQESNLIFHLRISLYCVLIFLCIRVQCMHLCSSWNWSVFFLNFPEANRATILL